ncbi:hypothetical protein OIN60_19880 [Paenibacillus sp. P96]|uniref:Tail tape measure protein n=1 Tax=Paenibacillus zeirhizosphaerae TaxID=2987519 RepID=A0ABT9FW85_9BACL|nr:hypothetical protein [Paenibacillus sp. P96]MDP4098988.1 hypothetical protein [Paenibacillus sp. P96]
MAKNLNYRINLVIEPKNVIRANRELRAMERYFERIQGRVLKIGRTRMMPEVVLKDNASKGLDQLLNKLNRVRSQILNASGTFSMKVTQSGEMSVKGLGLLALELDANTTALTALTEVMKQPPSGTASTGSTGSTASPGSTASNPKKWYEKATSLFTDVKNLGTGLQSGASAADNIKNFREKFVDGPAGGPPRTKFQKIVGGVTGVGTIASNIGDAGANIVGTLGKWGDAASGLFKGLLGNSEKLIGGPAGTILDAASIVTAESGKERTQAIGSTAGGVAGGAIGGAIGTIILPGVGTAVGGFVGSMVGDFIGGKAGGLIADYGPVIKEKVSSAAGWISEKASNIGQGIWNAGSAVKDFVGGKVRGLITDYGPAVKEKASNIGQGIWKAGSAVKDFVGGKVGGLITDYSPAIKEKVSTAAGWVSEKASNIGQGIGKAGGAVKNFIGEKVEGLVSNYGPVIKEKVSEITGWLSDKTSDIGKGVSKFFSWGKKDEPAKKETPAQPAVPPKPAVAPAVAPAVYPAVPPMNRAAMPVSPYAWPPNLLNPAAGVNPMLSAAAGANLAGAGVNPAVKGKGAQAPQVVQISPEQMTTLGTYLKDFKTETTNQISVNFPVGAVQMTVHENTLDIGAIVAQVAARLDAELRKAGQNRKPAVV